MKTISINLYSFAELNEAAQQKAIEKLSDINVNYEWWESTYEDAARAGIKLTGFDLDRNRHADGEFIGYATETARQIVADHGKECSTYKTAVEYLENIKVIDETTEDEGNEELTDIQDDFLKSLLEDYSIILQNEYEYQTSREAIIESIESNEYTFEQDGTMNNG